MGRQHGHGEPRSSALESHALALASGLLLAAPFLVASLGPLHWIALAPWVLMLRRPRAPHWLPASLLAGYGFFAMSFGPYSALHPLAPFWAALYYFLFLLPFAAVVRFVGSRTAFPMTLVVPVAWTAAEWLRVRVGEGGVSLFFLGSSQFELTPLIQLAEITGVAGISFLVAAGSGATVDLVAGLTRSPRRWRRPLVCAAAFAFVVAAVWVWGVWRLGRLETVPGPRIAVVQPDAIHYRDPGRVRDGIRHHAELTARLVEPGSARLVAWPENAVDIPFGDDPWFRRRLSRLSADLGAPLLVGAFRRSESDPAALHTSALLLTAGGTVRHSYDKIHLVPYAEYVPAWSRRLGGAVDHAHRRLVHRLLGYVPPGVPGNELTLFPLAPENGAPPGALRFAVPICYEVSDPRFARRAVRAGADFLLNVSSEGLFGEPVYRHMWGLSVLRAVEHRIPVVRAANHGISGFIAADGRPRGLVRGEGGRLFRTTGALTAPVPLNGAGAGSFHTRWGDLFAYLCLAGCIALVAAALAAGPPRNRDRTSRDRGRSSRP